jgi:hypothetical protein
MYVNLWIIEWSDRGRGGEAIDTATTPQDALETIHRFLDNETAFDEWARDDRPAFDVLFDGVDPITMVQEMDDRLELECDSGDFLVRRTMRFEQDQPPRFLQQAAPALLEFAHLFLAYHDAKTPETVTIRTLEHAARAAVAKANGDPPTSPMTAEIIQKLKEDYLEWTGGCTPDDEDEIFVYIELAMEPGPDAEEVRMVLRGWMEEANATDSLPTPAVIVDRKPAP